MKSISKLFYLSLFLIVFISCQKELIEVIQPLEGEALKANAVVTTLVKQTAAKDGSKDNIIDKASCLNVQLPVTVVVNGLEIIIDSEADYEVIESIFDEFDDDIDKLDILFPMVVILSDYTEVEIHNMGELESYRANCGGENEMDDDIECLDFVYPITLSIYDTANQLVENVSIEDDMHFYKLIDHIEDYHVVVVNFPIDVVLYDGTLKTIENMEALEYAIETVKGMCDEDDDNDYEDDDCMNCTQNQTTELLLSCSWSIDKLEIDGVNNTEQYSNFIFTFFEDGTLKAELNGNFDTGTWEVSHSEEGMGMSGHQGVFIDIKMDYLADFSFKWALYEIENNNELDLRFGNNRLEMEKNCIDEKVSLVNILNEGSWLVANFTNKGETSTSTFNDFVIDFKEDFTATATKGNDIIQGTWGVIYDSGKMKLQLGFGDTIPFNIFNNAWNVIDVKDKRVEVNLHHEGMDVMSKLVFERF